MGVLGTDARIVEPGRDGVGLEDLSLLVLQECAAHAVEHPGDARWSWPLRRPPPPPPAPAAVVSANPAKIPAALDPPPAQATTTSGSPPSRSARHCSRASSPITRWNSRTIHGYGWGPMTEPRQ